MRYSFLYLFCLLIFSHFVQADNNIDSLEKQLEKANELNKIDVLIILSKAHWTIAPSKGLFYSNEAVKLAEKHNDEYKKAKALLYGGVNAWFLGDYKKAIEYCQKSLIIAEEIQDKRLSAYNLNNLGMVNFHLKNYEKALSNYLESSSIIRELGDEIEYAKIINNIGELNVILGNYDEALINHLSILDIIESSDEQEFLIWLLNDIGIVYSKKENYKMALQYFFKSLKISNEIDDNVGKIEALNCIGAIYLKKKEYTKAKEYFYNGLMYAKKTDTKENIKENYKNLSEYYSEVDNYKKSLEYHKLYKQISDSIINDNKIDKIVEMQIRYETESKEKENNILRKNNEIKGLIIEKQIYLRNFFIVLLTLAILLIILIYSRFSIKKRTNHELNEKNNLITKQKNKLSKTLIKLQEVNNELEQQKEEIQTQAKELETTNKKLKELNATKDKFFSIIAHDLKSPFTALLGFSNLLMENYAKYNEEKRKRYIKFINDNLIKTYKLLENLLTWAHSQIGRIEFLPEKINIKTLIYEIISLLEEVAQNKNIKLLDNTESSLFVYADKNMIDTVLRNLITNAIKFTPKGGEIIIKAHTLTDENNQKITEITVKDSGVGISPEIQSNLFKITETISTKGTENETGTGLGLILCKEFVEKHDGKIWVESEEGKGSIFHFMLPFPKK